jgi:hypothetical protein
MSTVPGHSRFLPSTFDLSGDFHIVEIPRDTPWDRLTNALREKRPEAVFGLLPEKLQLDVRVYDTVRAEKIPYMSCNPRNTALACELMRQMRANLVVATREEALALDAALTEMRREPPTWFVILRQDEAGLDLPLRGEVLTEVHASPGIPL